MKYGTWCCGILRAGGGAGAKLSTHATLASQARSNNASISGCPPKASPKLLILLLFHKDMDRLINEILTEAKAFGSRGGSQEAESRDLTCVAAVETAPQLKCAICGRNTVGVL